MFVTRRLTGGLGGKDLEVGLEPSLGFIMLASLDLEDKVVGFCKVGFLTARTVGLEEDDDGRIVLVLFVCSGLLSFSSGVFLFSLVPGDKEMNISPFPSVSSESFAGFL